MMIAKIKSWIFIIGGLITTIITLGLYGKYQKFRADKATQTAKQADALYRKIKKQIKKGHEAEAKNQLSRKAANEQKENRAYFDNH